MKPTCSSVEIARDCYDIDDYYPEKQGYDVNIAGCDMGQPVNYFDPYSNKKGVDFPTLQPRKEGEYLVDRLADEAKKIQVTQPEHKVEEGELIADYSYAILMGIFCVVVTGIFALVGATINGSQGFLWGSLLGVLLGTIVFSVAIRL